MYFTTSGFSSISIAMLLVASGSAGASTIDDVRARDKLVCGVSEGLRGFSQKDASGVWSGFDVDFCKAVAAAVLGDTGKVDYVPLSAGARFLALNEGKIDLLSRNSTWTMSRDLVLGLDFAGISYFDGQGFLVPTLYGVNSPLQLDAATICVVRGTTTQDNAANYFKAAGVTVEFLAFDERLAARNAYAEGACDAYTADRSALAAERSLLVVPGDHVILPEIVSKEPLGPVTREDDRRWTELVRWTLFALINAEERGLDMAAAKGARAGEAATMGASASGALHLEPDWVARVIGSVGHYGEIFDRNLGENTPLALRRGLNALWSEGGLLYAPPMQ